MTLKLFVVIQSCYMPSSIVLGSMVPELHMRIVCLIRAVTPGRVTIKIFLTLEINYTRFCLRNY